MPRNRPWRLGEARGKAIPTVATPGIDPIKV